MISPGWSDGQSGQAAAAAGERQPRRERGWLAPFVLVLLVAALAGGISGGIVAHVEAPPEAKPQVQATAAPTATAVTALPDIPAIISQVRRSVVAISITTTVGAGPRTFTTEAAGSGFVLSADGLIATNYHVIQGANSIRVTLPDGSALAAVVVGTDSGNDLAVVRVERTDLVPMLLGNSTGLRVGDLVIAVGNALALEGGPTASLGIVSALERSVTTTDGRTARHLIQTDAAINEGDSGGPLTNGKGELVGINSVGATSAENIGFAIAIDAALPVLQRLLAAGQ